MIFWGEVGDQQNNHNALKKHLYAPPTGTFVQPNSNSFSTSYNRYITFLQTRVCPRLIRHLYIQPSNHYNLLFIHPLNLRRVQVSVLHVLLHRGQLAGVQRRVGEGGVHPWQPQAGHKDVDEASEHQVPVERCSFQQPVGTTATIQTHQPQSLLVAGALTVYQLGI